MVKSYTDIPQSKMLAGFLSIESADMWYGVTYKKIGREDDDFGESIEYIELSKYPDIKETAYTKKGIPAWSLAALRVCLPPGISFNGILYVFESHNTFNNEWVYEYKFEDISAPLYSKSSNEIDACLL